MMTEQDLQAIEQRANAATPGPWEVAPWGSLPNGYLYGTAELHGMEPDPPGLMRAIPPVSFVWEDANFIAHARQDIPALLTEVRRLKATEAACALLLKNSQGKEAGKRWVWLGDAIDAAKAALSTPLPAPLLPIS